MLCTRLSTLLASKVYSCYTAGRGTHKINLQAIVSSRERVVMAMTCEGDYRVMNDDCSDQRERASAERRHKTKPSGKVQ